MPRLLFLAWKNLGYNRLRSLLTLGAVALGVAMLTAALVTNRTQENDLVRVAQEVVGKADLEIRAFSPAGISQESIDRLRVLPGVKDIAPYLRKRTFYRIPHERGFLELIGIDPLVEVKIHSYLLSDGVFLADEANNTVLLLADWANEREMGVGDSMELVTSQGFQSFTINGLLSQAGIAEDQFGRVAIVSLKTAQTAFGLGGRVSHVSLTLSPGTDPAAFTASLPQAISEDYLVVRPEEIKAEILSSLADLRALLLLFATISLFVAGFLIYNTLAIAVSERVRLFGLLRAVGTTGAQVIQLVLIEAGLLGLLGGAAGVVLGTGLSFVLIQWVVQFQGSATIPGIALAGQDALFSLFAGLGLALLAGFVPAWRASRVTPVESLRPNLVPGYAAWDPGQWLWGLFLSILGLGLVYLALGQSQPLGVLGILLLCLGIVPLTQPLVGPLSSLATIPFAGFMRRELELARRNPMRTPGRTALTVGALAVAIATILSLGILTVSSWSAGEDWVKSLFSGPWVVVSPVTQPMAIAAEFSKIPGVSQVLPLRKLAVSWQGVSLEAIGMDLGSVLEGGALEIADGERGGIIERLQSGDDRIVFLPVLLADRFALKVGDRLTLKTLEGPQDFHIAATLVHSFPAPRQEGAIIIDRQAMLRDFGAEGFDLLNLQDDGQNQNVKATIAEKAELYGMEFSGVDQLQTSVRDSLSRLFALLSATVLAALLVGGLGMANTMMVNVNERRYEIGVLRAAGMTVGEIQNMFLAEGGMMGVIASLLGAGMSLLLAGAMVRFLQSPDFTPAFTIPWELILPGLVLPLFISVLATLYPARAAAKTPTNKILRLWE